MLSGSRLIILGYAAAAALAGGVGVVLLERLSVIHPSTAEYAEGGTTTIAMTGSLRGSEPVAVEAEPLTRIAFIPPDVLPLRGETLDDTPAAIAPPAAESENPDNWGIETSVQAALPAPAAPAPVNGAAPRVAAPSSEALPWQQHAQTAAKPHDVTLQERLSEISPAATQRLTEKFQSAHASWPPAEAALVAIKDAKTLELHVRNKGGTWTFVHRYPVLAASGSTGPKLRQGDKQVPEGVYGVSLLNPNSKYHVSLRVNYPNDFDRQMATKDGRKELGGDIMIHGKAVSIGCLAVGDAASEELFVLAAQVGLPNVKVVIAPTDLRQGIPDKQPGQPEWLPQLYKQVASSMTDYKAPPTSFASGLLSFFEK